MTLLLVTGKNAEDAVRAYAKKCGVPVRIHVCNYDVASLLTLEVIEKELKGASLSGISMVILPGGVKGDASKMAARLGIPCFKGTRNIADLPAVLEFVSKKNIALSPKEPADTLIQKELAEKTRKELAEAEEPVCYTIKIGRKNPVYLGGGVSRIVAEINEAVRLSKPDLIKQARYYLSSGASIIDLGMPSGGGNEEKIPPLIENLRKNIRTPISIDSAEEKEILAAADSGIDLILSVDEKNQALLDSISVPAVVIPRDKKGIVPQNTGKKLAIIKRILSNRDTKNIILDPVLSPLNYGFSRSLADYVRFREEFPDTSMLLGAGNVTELLDADSIGANALLAGFASELSIDLLLTTEASPKTKGAVRELSKAAGMMYLAKKRGQPPKDLPINLLVLKDKRCIFDTLLPKGLRKVKAAGELREELEDCEFRIFVCKKRICAVCCTKGGWKIMITGNSAKEVYSEIIRRRLTRSLDHAAYLGRELGKAEIAMRLGKCYVQDADLFKTP